MEEPAAFSSGCVQFVPRICRWVIIPLVDYWMMTQLLKDSPEESSLRDVFKNVL